MLFRSVSVGDKINQGMVIATIDATDKPSVGLKVAEPLPAAPVEVAKPASIIPVAGSYAGKVDHECEMLVLGAGPGGYSAAFRSADLGMSTIIVER